MIDNTQGLSGAYQGIYSAGLARINQNTAAAKGRALRAAANQGVMTSGVSQISQQGLDKEGMQEGADLAANVVGKQYQDNRYSTAGGSRASNIQPIFADLAGGGLAGLGSILSK